MCTCSGVIDEGGTKEYSFGLITNARTYHLTAEDAEDRMYVPKLVFCYQFNLQPLYSDLVVRGWRS